MSYNSYPTVVEHANNMQVFVKLVWKYERIQIDTNQIIKVFGIVNPTNNVEYEKWLTETYQRKNFCYKEMLEQTNNRVFQILWIFDRYKNNLKPEQKLIFNYSGLEDIFHLLESYVQADLQSKSLDSYERFILEETINYPQMKAENNSLIIVKNYQAKIFVALNVDAVRWWSKGTKWYYLDPSSGNEYKFDKNKSVFFVIFFRDIDGNERKLNLWIFKKRYGYFFDENKKTLDADTYKSNMHILEPLVFWTIKYSYYNCFHLIPDECLTYDLCKKSRTNEWQCFKKYTVKI